MEDTDSINGARRSRRRNLHSFNSFLISEGLGEELGTPEGVTPEIVSYVKGQARFLLTDAEYGLLGEYSDPFLPIMNLWTDEEIAEYERLKDEADAKKSGVDVSGMSSTEAEEYGRRTWVPADEKRLNFMVETNDRYLAVVREFMGREARDRYDALMKVDTKKASDDAAKLVQDAIEQYVKQKGIKKRHTGKLFAVWTKDEISTYERLLSEIDSATNSAAAKDIADKFYAKTNTKHREEYSNPMREWSPEDVAKHDALRRSAKKEDAIEYKRFMEEMSKKYGKELERYARMLHQGTHIKGERRIEFSPDTEADLPVSIHVLVSPHDFYRYKNGMTDGWYTGDYRRMHETIENRPVDVGIIVVPFGETITGKGQAQSEESDNAQRETFGKIVDMLDDEEYEEYEKLMTSLEDDRKKLAATKKALEADGSNQELIDDVTLYRNDVNEDIADIKNFELQMYRKYHKEEKDKGEERNERYLIFSIIVTRRGELIDDTALTEMTEDARRQKAQEKQVKTTQDETVHKEYVSDIKDRMEKNRGEREEKMSKAHSTFSKWSDEDKAMLKELRGKAKSGYHDDVVALASFMNRMDRKISGIADDVEVNVEEENEE